LSGYNFQVLYKKGSENIAYIISRLDYANQLKPSDDSVAKCKKNVPKIDYVSKNKTNSMISEQQQSPLVQNILSESALVPPKLLSQPHDIGANYSSVDYSLKKNLPPLMVPRSKTINISTPISSQDVPGVYLESKNYILPINFEAVLDKSMHSDTVYAAENITSEGIHIGNLDNAG